MSKLSVFIPSRNELFVSKTVDDIFNKSVEEIEVIVVHEETVMKLNDHKNLIEVYNKVPRGLRGAVNQAAMIATGEWFLKCDAHCMFSPGFDAILKKNCEKNWVVIPPRYSLDAENWDIDRNGKPRRDYHYLSFPDLRPDNKGGGLHGVEWWERCKQRLDSRYDIDENPSFQGSCWFMHRTWFTDFLKGMSCEGYGTFSQEPQEIGMKTWLGGGKVMVNKGMGKLWYAHLHKGHRYGRMYNMDGGEVTRGHRYSADYWVNSRWPNKIHDFSWFIDEKFPGMPTWPANWQKLLRETGLLQ